MSRPSKSKALDALNKLNNYSKLPVDHRWVSTVRHYIKEEKTLQSAPPTNKQSTKLKPSLCRCANCEAVQSLNNIFCSRCGTRF